MTLAFIFASGVNVGAGKGELWFKIVGIVLNDKMRSGIDGHLALLDSNTRGEYKICPTDII